jgi:hypothetical protein
MGGPRERPFPILRRAEAHDGAIASDGDLSARDFARPGEGLAVDDEMDTQLMHTTEQERQ